MDKHTFILLKNDLNEINVYSFIFQKVFCLYIQFFM